MIYAYCWPMMLSVLALDGIVCTFDMGTYTAFLHMRPLAITESGFIHLILPLASH